MTSISSAIEDSRQNSLIKFFKFFGRARNLAMLLVFASFVSWAATYVAITQTKDPLGPDPASVMGLILTDLVFLLALGGVISKRLIKMLMERRKGLAGSRLQVRIAVMFSLVAIIPTILIATFSTIFFNYGIQSWFNERIHTAIGESVAVAEAYLEEHKKIIHADMLGMESDLNREAYKIRANPRAFNKILSLLAGVRKIPEAMVFQYDDNQKSVLARTNLSFSLEFTLEDLSFDALQKAEDGEIVVLTNQDDDRVIAISKLDSYFDTYLIIGRFVDNKIINHIELTRGAANDYSRLKQDIVDLQIKFSIVYIVVALLLLLIVVWFGILFATDLVKPLGAVIKATEEVKKGNLHARVAEGHKDDEIAHLGRSFNRMTEQLDRQRTELISAQRTAAWGDVARRIAHEIKNPLTPIHLAAERLNRKYSAEVKDNKNFHKYIDTITRHVADIRDIVEEFVDFARMPAPEMEKIDLVNIIQDVVFEWQGRDNIEITTDGLDKSIYTIADGGQIAQVFTNLIKNAEEAMDGQDQGKINVSLEEMPANWHITIIDNGSGFPENFLERVAEPYVTTKVKGTGLGLAIVKKIIEDHDGEIHFSNHENGAAILVVLPKGALV